jgi:hypothetical protein
VYPDVLAVFILDIGDLRPPRDCPRCKSAHERHEIERLRGKVKHCAKT